MTRQRDYGRDPLEILIEREGRTCKGCDFVELIFGRQVCSAGKSLGRRCKNYVKGDGMQNAHVSELSVQRSPFDEVMSIWGRWVALKDRQSPDGDSNLQDTRDFMRIGDAVEVMINDLPRIQWWAVRKSRGISTVWLFPNASFSDEMRKAEEILTLKMRSHLATRRYFQG